jgi:membrane protease YdiL (CAAX protease family)
MIPDRDLGARPPLTLEFAFLLALIAPLAHGLCMLVLIQIGFRGLMSVAGMGAVLAYSGIFALCAVRFQRPPMQQLALVTAPALAWLAVVFLLPSVVLTSEIDNVVQAFFPLPVDPAPATGEALPFLGPTLAIVVVAVFPVAYELFFRGILQPLATARLGAIAGILVTALLSGVALGLILGGPWGLAPAFAGALVLCILRQASGSLWPPIALHALTGLTRLAAQYELFGLAGFDDVTAAHTPVPWLAGAVVSTAIGFWLLRVAARGPATER